jgi:hypothetical protein
MLKKEETEAKEAKEALEEEQGNAAFNEKDMFDISNHQDDEEEENQNRINEFLDEEEKIDTKEEELDEEEEGKNPLEEEVDDFNFDGSKKEKEEAELDLELFNKKFDQKFKTEQEMKDFFKGEDAKEELDTDDKSLSDSENQLNLLSPLLELNDKGKYVFDDEALLTKQFESIALQNGKDLNDEDVQYEIQEKLEDIRSKGVVNLQADSLRDKMLSIVNNATKNKETILGKRETIKLEGEKISKEKLQNEFVEFAGAESFYGVTLDKKKVGEIYQKVISGEFIKNLQSDNKAMAELALMAANKEIIFKKSSGLTYSDGLKAVVDEYKSKPKESSVAGAQKRGSSGSAEGSKGLIEDLLYEAPTEK